MFWNINGTQSPKVTRSSMMFHGCWDWSWIETSNFGMNREKMSDKQLSKWHQRVRLDSLREGHCDNLCTETRQLWWWVLGERQAAPSRASKTCRTFRDNLHGGCPPQPIPVFFWCTFIVLFFVSFIFITIYIPYKPDKFHPHNPHKHHNQNMV